MAANPSQNLGPLLQIPVELEAQLDQRMITMREILTLVPGTLLRLERSAGENIDLLSGGALIGYGEIAVLENMLCIRLTDLRREH